MNLSRTLRLGALFLVTGLGLGSCLNPPEYPIEPSIELNEVIKVHYPASVTGIPIDSLVIKISFRDGDGDLGLSKDNVNVAPYNSTTGGPRNLGYKNNYIIQPLVKDANGRFVRFVTPPPLGAIGEFDGRYPRLDGAEAKAAPLKGELRCKVPILIGSTTLQAGQWRAGQVLRFEISILDRALHQSNTVTTPDVVVGP